MRNFCHNCAKSVNADWLACPYCRTDLTSLASVPPPQPVSVSKAAGFVPFSVPVSKDDDDDDDYIDKLTHAPIRQNKLMVDIILNKPPTETVGGAILAGVSPPTENFKRPEIDPAQALEIYKKEAGTLRTNEK